MYLLTALLHRDNKCHPITAINQQLVVNFSNQSFFVVIKLSIFEPR